MTIAVDFAPGLHHQAVEERLATWERQRFGARLWEKDFTLWSSEPVAELRDRLGWLDLPHRVGEVAGTLSDFARTVSQRAYRHAVVLGMGGSSLAPEVFQLILGNAADHPELMVVDSTHPGAVTSAAERIDIARTLFIVSSKSGTTLETLSLFRYFWSRAAAAIEAPGDHFVAVTDAGSSLEALARERGFTRVFNAPSDVGGRYSALTEFGLVPAASIGADLQAMHRSATEAAAACGPEVPALENPGLRLGAYLGELALAGRDKATFLAPDRLRPLVAWIEQLVAESTGKDGTGILPVGGDDDVGAVGSDRAPVYIGEEGTSDTHATLRLDGVQDLAGAMFVLEVAVAAAGAVLGIQPFNQPDVQLAKDLANRAMAGDLDTSSVVEIQATDADLAGRVAQLLSGVAAPEYVGIHAYLPPTAATRSALQTARVAIRDGCGVATTFDFGPRFLHSTGQMHKGGPPIGRFLQVVDDPAPAVDVPETDFGFGDLIRAQALGDHQALADRGQRILLVSLGDSGPRGLERLVAAVAAASGR